MHPATNKSVCSTVYRNTQKQKHKHTLIHVRTKKEPYFQQSHTHTRKYTACEEPVCFRVLQCAAVRCSVLQCVAVRCSVLQCITVRCSALQCVAVRCSVQCIAVHCSVRARARFRGTNEAGVVSTRTINKRVLQRVAACCSVLQCVAVCCSV